MRHADTRWLPVAARSWAPSVLRRWGVWSILLTWLALGCQVLFGEVKVNGGRGNGAAAVCSVGDFRCNGEYLLSCDSPETGWALKETCDSGDLCDAKNKRCDDCKDGDFRCLLAERQQCTPDGTWQKAEDCSAENLCSESSCKGCTTDGQLDCSVAPTLRQCENGLWVTLDTCGSQTICEATTAYATTAPADWAIKCLEPGCPLAGAYRCEDTVLERCPPERDAWITVDTCANTALCNNAVASVNADPNAVATLDMCKPACPNAGAFVCDGANLQLCRPDQTGYDLVKACPPNTECDPVAGGCGELCTPGHFQCNGLTLRKCGSNGHWVDDKTCESAALCTVDAEGATGSCTPSPCGTKAYTCVGAELQKCKDDRTAYEPNKICASAALCDAVSERCIDPTCPTSGAYQCFGLDLKQCDADLTKWDLVTSCPAGQYCNSGTNPGCLTSCPDNPLRCNGKVMEHCSADTGWTTQATCSTPDLCSCALTDPDGSGPQTNSCLLGLFKDGCGNVVCGGSKANYQCQGAELQKCQAGRNGWDKAATCGASNLCYPGESPTYTSGYCLTCPTAGELSCNGKTLRVCSNDRRSWDTSANCGIECVGASGNDYCAACSSGSAQCAGATLQVCPANEKAWNNTTCNSAALCDKTNQQCDVCTKTVCNGDVLEKCSNGGQTLQSQTCGSGDCDATNAQCDKCVANQVWCDGASLNKCSADGQSQTTTKCLTAGLCDMANQKCQTPFCKVGEERCMSGTTLQICNADRTDFKTLDVCASSALCDNSKAASASACIQPDCKLTDVSCNGAQPQICKADLTGFQDSGVGPCASAALCVKGGCKAPFCMATDPPQCAGAQPQICNTDLTGYVASGKGCGSAELCFHGACTQCAPNKPQCNGAQLQVCKADGSGFTNTTCGSAAQCNTTTSKCDPCLAGSKKCDAMTGNLQVCRDDQSGYTDTGGTDCGTAGCSTTTNSCNPAVVCTSGMYQCVGTGNKLLQQCNAGGTAWSPGKACPVICDPAQGECDECVAPNISCAMNVLQVCTKDGHYTTTDCKSDMCNATGSGSCDPVENAGSSGMDPSP